jgi:hypothetical protein
MCRIYFSGLVPGKYQGDVYIDCTVTFDITVYYNSSGFPKEQILIFPKPLGICMCLPVYESVLYSITE